MRTTRGRAEDSVISAYDRHGAAWAKLRGEQLVEAHWLNRFCSLLPPGGSVLDIGCGSGIPLARELLRRGFDVTGVDGSRTMIELFGRNLPGTPAHFTDMRRLELNRRYAGLLAWDSFFHLSPGDQRAMIARFEAHSEPNAALMFTSGDTEGSAAGNLEGDPLYHGSLGPREYRALLHAAGFEVIQHIAEDPDCGNRTVWLSRRSR
jgi:hypothetical protein